MRKWQIPLYVGCNTVLQGGDTPIYSVLRSSSSVKLKVKGQPLKIADSQSQTAFWLIKSQPRLSRRIRILYFISG